MDNGPGEVVGFSGKTWAGLVTAIITPAIVVGGGLIQLKIDAAVMRTDITYLKQVGESNAHVLSELSSQFVAYKNLDDRIRMLERERRHRELPTE